MAVAHPEHEGGSIPVYRGMGVRSHCSLLHPELLPLLYSWLTSY